MGLLVRGLLEKPKTKPRELILEVDNIIPLWRSIIPNRHIARCMAVIGGYSKPLVPMFMDHINSCNVMSCSWENGKLQ